MTTAELAAEALRHYGIRADVSGPSGETLIIYGATFTAEQRNLCERIWAEAERMTGWTDLRVAEGL